MDLTTETWMPAASIHEILLINKSGFTSVSVWWFSLIFAASLPTGPVLDADEPADIQQVRRRIHEVRVSLIRAAMRLGYDTENALVHQVIYRLALAEKLKAPWRKSSRRPDPKAAAMREAMQLEQEAGGSSGEAGKPLGFCVKMMVVGLAGEAPAPTLHSS